MKHPTTNVKKKRPKRVTKTRRNTSVVWGLNLLTALTIRFDESDFDTGFIIIIKYFTFPLRDLERFELGPILFLIFVAYIFIQLPLHIAVFYDQQKSLHLVIAPRGNFS
ncbi:hypothetical protein ILYODFUR_038615 [Ilyodon furcidens]|uniref:Uncharacterized protein n=1 Tax=Ilyodon furcidens TaxID=33524 RepID=A0ABV0UBW7_9TELE